MTLLQRLKYEFTRPDNAITRLLKINVAVFGFSLTMVLLAYLFKWPHNPSHQFVTNPVLEYFYLPTLYKDIAMRPWTILTHMFFHAGFLHLLFNMLMLYFMGKITVQFISNERIYKLYFLGGLAGIVLSTLAFNFLPVFQDIGRSIPSLGASAAVMSIVIGTTTLVPNLEVFLYGLIRMKLKWLGIIIVVLDLISIPQGNAGGHIAHLGGAFFGFAFISMVKEGWKFPSFKFRNPFSGSRRRSRLDERDILRNTTKKREPAYHQSVHESGRKASRNTDEKPNQEEIDAILDKISQSGYPSLTDKEKEILFRASE